MAAYFDRQAAAVLRSAVDGRHGGGLGGRSAVGAGDRPGARARQPADHGRRRRARRCGWSARDPTLLGQGLTIEAEGQTHKVTLPLIGAYQAANALVAAGLVIATGGDVAATLANLARLQPVRGRLERAVISAAGAPVYVDYAHTPDALEAAIAALQAACRRAG